MPFIIFERQVNGIAKHKLTLEHLDNIDKNEWLTDRQRKVFELFYRRGWAIEDIAAETSVSRSTVDRELHIIRQSPNEVKMMLK